MIPDKEKIPVFETLMQNIYMCRNITLDTKRLLKLLDASDSYCRSTDYPYEDYEEHRDMQFRKLRDVVYN